MTHPPSTAVPPRQELDFADFVEKVNGRCAITGLYIGKAIFQFTGQDLVQQLVEDPVKAGMFVGGDFTVVTLLTLVFYKPTDYDNFIEFSNSNKRIIGKAVVF